MPVVTLFGPPEPEAKNVVGTADVVNYFPKRNLQGQLLWEQRPGLAAVTLGNQPLLRLSRVGIEIIAAEEASDVVLTRVAIEVLAAEEEDEENGENDFCIPTYYAWSVGYNSWQAYGDGTLYADNLIQPEVGIATMICHFNINTHIENPEGKKWTVKGVYRNDSNSKISLKLTTMLAGGYGPIYSGLQLDHSVTSKRFHINLTSLYLVELRSLFITDPSVWPGLVLPDTENWIECIRIEKNDFGAEPEATIIYD